MFVEAIIRRKDEVNAVLAAVVFRIGNVQLYERNRNHLNFVIIPAALGFIIFLFTVTFLLRRMRFVWGSSHPSQIVLPLCLEMDRKGVTSWPNY